MLVDRHDLITHCTTHHGAMHFKHHQHVTYRQGTAALGVPTSAALLLVHQPTAEMLQHMPCLLHSWQGRLAVHLAPAVMAVQDCWLEATQVIPETTLLLLFAGDGRWWYSADRAVSCCSVLCRHGEAAGAWFCSPRLPRGTNQHRRAHGRYASLAVLLQHTPCFLNMHLAALVEHIFFAFTLHM
jgi:hypothetical protein